MNTCVKSPVFPVKPSIDGSSRRQWFRLAILVIGFTSAALALALTPQMSYAGTATVTGSWAAADLTTAVPTIPPAGVQTAVFAAYNGGGPYHFVAYPFTVNTTGIYSATASTPVVINTSWFLSGLFTRGTPPPTPIGNFFAGVFTGIVKDGITNQYTGHFTNLSLVAGQQYTVLVAYNIGGAAGEVSTVTITGPGCIAIGGNTCSAAASVPTLSEWGMILLAGLLAVLGVAFVRRRRDTI